MSVSATEIKRVVAAPGRLTSTSAPETLTVGVEATDGRYHWGDCHLAAPDDQSVSSIDLLVDLSTAVLRGQRLAHFRDLCARLAVFGEELEGVVPPQFMSALQQALLEAISHSNYRHPADLLIDEYQLAKRIPADTTVSLFLEISDYAATADKIDAMLSLRPAGIGYRLTGDRVAEAIGESGEYLQRFVRELTQRAAVVAGQAASPPAIYLGLRGALGRLVDDPLTQIGKILGHCVGLNEASAPAALYLEEPFLLEDAMLQPAHLQRLADFLRRSPAVSRRSSRPLLVSRASGLTDEPFNLYVDLRSVEAIAFDVPIIGGIDQMMNRLALLESAGISPVFTFSAQSGTPVTQRWRETMIAAALACRSAVLLVNYGSNPGNHVSPIIRALTESQMVLGNL